MSTEICRFCYGPAEPSIVMDFGEGLALAACRPCSRAWPDPELLAQLRADACAAGHHRYPGRWTVDPTDPYGDARYWECAKGCGYRRTHPGYGTGRRLHELGFAGPAQLALDLTGVAS